MHTTRIIITLCIALGCLGALRYSARPTHTITHDGITIMQAHRKKTPPQDTAKVPFGTLFTDHMFVMEWTEEKGWHNARIQPYAPFTFEPSSLHMHYGAEIFEGMKAYRRPAGASQLFRPEENFARMNQSARRMCMPEIDPAFALRALKLLLKQDEQWIPKDPGTALYIRPTMIATESTINLKPSAHFLFFIIMSPVGSLYKNGFNPIAIMVADEFTRASVGGVGTAKTGGNYAASMLAQEQAHKKGFAQVLWLDPIERTYVEEAGSMNVFFVIDGVLTTPALNGTILPGITRKSILALANHLGIPTQERRISIDEVARAIKDGSCSEIFGTGTAAVISPIGTLAYKDAVYTVHNNETGPITQQLYEQLTGIQWGRLPDAFGWCVTL